MEGRVEVLPTGQVGEGASLNLGLCDIWKDGNCNCNFKESKEEQKESEKEKEEEGEARAGESKGSKGRPVLGRTLSKVLLCPRPLPQAEKFWICATWLGGLAAFQGRLSDVEIRERCRR